MLDFIVKVSLGLAYPQQIIKLYHTVLTDRGRAAAAAERASKTHGQLADAHEKKADFWKEMVGSDVPDYANHINAMHRHRKTAAELASHHRDLANGKLEEHRMLTSEFDSNHSHKHANVQLMHLEASNAYERARKITYNAGDIDEAKKMFDQMRYHGQMSVVQKFDTEKALGSASNGKFHANWTYNLYKKREERKRGEASGSGDHR